MEFNKIFYKLVRTIFVILLFFIPTILYIHWFITIGFLDLTSDMSNSFSLMASILSPVIILTYASWIAVVSNVIINDIEEKLGLFRWLPKPIHENDEILYKEPIGEFVKRGYLPSIIVITIIFLLLIISLGILHMDPNPRSFTAYKLLPIIPVVVIPSIMVWLLGRKYVNDGIGRIYHFRNGEYDFFLINGLVINKWEMKYLSQIRNGFQYRLEDRHTKVMIPGKKTRDLLQSAIHYS